MSYNYYQITPIIVRKSEKYHESQNSNIGCYYAKSKKRGICLFFNNIDYIGNTSSKRLGAEVDQEKLEDLFNQIGIEFRSYVNKTKQEIEDILNEFVKTPQPERVDCVFIIVSSHGQIDFENNDFFKCCDGNRIFDKDIIVKFNNNNCSILKDIPKIFIFQKCRNRECDIICTHIPEDTNSKESNSTMNTYSDILIVYSTIKGATSGRDIIEGSWCFIAICKVFMEHAHNTHIKDLFMMVDEEMKKINFEEVKILSDDERTLEISAFNFNPYLFLNPGYFGD